LTIEHVVVGGVCILWLALLRQAFRQAAQLICPELRKNHIETLGQVAVFMPARNEEEIVEASIRSVFLQGDIIEKLVVIDDQSTDRTADILKKLAAEFPKLEVLRGTGPKPGHCGKPSALVTAYEQCCAQTESLLFLDADVELQPGALSTLLAWAQENQRDLVSGFLEMTMVTPLEKVVMPTMAALIGRRYAPEKVMDANSSIAFANGQLILIKKSAYEHIGGHQAVVSEILEDVRLAEKVKQAGFHLGVVDLRKIAKTRMYTHWAELREGWTKNVFLLMGGRVSQALTWSFLSVLIGCSGLFILIFCSWPLGLLGFVFVTISQMLIRYRLGFPWTWAVFSPLGSCLSAYLLLRSTWKHGFKQKISWKGRSYS